MTCAALDNLGEYDCIMIVTDHSDYDYQRIVCASKLAVNTRNATRDSTRQELCAADR